MKEPRIIKASVRTAIEAAVRKNKQRNIYDSKDWYFERYMYTINIPGGKQMVVELRGDRVLTDMSTLPEECYDAVLSREEVYSAIDKERAQQDDKWGPNRPQSLPGFLNILEAQLQEAKTAWVKNVLNILESKTASVNTEEGDQAPLNEIVQLAATAVACLEKYGTIGTATATNDIPNNT